MRPTKKPAAILISVVMAFAMMPALPMAAVESYGAEGVTYLDADGSTKTVSDYYSVDDLADAEGISMYDGNAPGYESYYVVSGDKTFENRLSAFGEVHLILKDGAKLTLRKGLNVPEGSSLLIYAQSTGSSKGKIFAATSNVYSDHAGINIKYAAAIGGNDGNPGGTITINGGDITAHGYNYGAGIGSGDEAGDAGNIVINGGSVNAYGGYDAAGIGGGNETNGGEIAINGGDVHAESGYYGAAIGGGDDAGGGHIVINGGKVYARNKGHDDGITTSKVAGAAIGGGRHGNAGKIEIKGGEVTAWSMQRGAGIGSGGDNNSDSQKYNGGYSGGEIYISGGTITADSNYNRTSTMRLFEDGGAGIGSGAGSYGVRIEITGGHTTAYGSCYDAEDPDLLHPTGIKPSAVIGNGYDTQSEVYVRIAGDENSKTYVHAAAASQNAIGKEPGGKKDCTVIFDYPRAIVEKDNYGEILNAADRFTMIEEHPQHAYKIYLCDHGRTFYETDREGHWKICEQCGLEIEKQAHTFTYVQEGYGHSQWCEECGHVIASVRHTFDPSTGKCVCGLQAVKVTIDPKNADYSGGEIVNWLERGETYTLPDPEDIEMMPPELAEFKCWRVNGSWQEFSPGDELTLQADTVVYPVYETSWDQFKALVEGADDGATIVLPGNCKAPSDATHIVIPQGKSLILDLNGYELARGNSDVTVTDGLGDGDVITVKGELTVKDSSSDKTGLIRGGSNLLVEGDSVSDESIGGGGVTVAGGSFLLESGTLSGNIANKGGAVGVYGGGTFTMTGGKIEDNMTWNAGSAVYVEDGVFKAQGGEITDNQVLKTGGAVEFTSNGSVEVSGSPKITGNQRYDVDASAFVPGNVYLAEGQTITVAGVLDSSAEIGVSGNDIVGTQMTTGLSGNGSASIFVSDNADIAFEEIGGEIQMASASTDTHRIEAEIRGNGRVVYSARKAAQGNTVSLRAVPDEGYRFDRWEVVGEGASLSDTTIAETILTMGIEDVTIKVYFVEDTNPVTGVTINTVDGEEGTAVETPLADGAELVVPQFGTLKLSASVEPSDATDPSVAWRILDDMNNCLAISEDGVVTANNPGHARVLATAGDITVSVGITVAERYAVTFDADGGTGVDDTVYVYSGSTVARPEDPAKEDYAFVGWRKVEDGGELADVDYDFTSEVNGSFTLKAVWKHTKHDEASMEHHDLIAATCTEDGRAEYWHCDVCDKDFIFVDSNKTIAEEVTDDDIVIPAGHIYGTWGPLDEENHQRVCTADPSHTETQAHVWTRGEVTTEPTDTEEGTMTYTCEVCGEEKTALVTMADVTEYEVNTYLEGPYGSGEVWTEPVKGIKGTKIQLTAFPEDGFKFSGWEIEGADCEDPTALSIVVTIGESNVNATATFSCPIDEANLVLEKASVVYNGKAQKLVVKTIGGHTLDEGKDYTLTIRDAKGNAVTSPKAAGTYTVTAEGNGTTCTGTSASVKYTIRQVPLASAKPKYTALIYTGKARTQSVTVKANVAGAAKTLTKDTDYKVSYSKNKNVGTATMTITGKGNYSGSKTVRFRINPKGTSISKLTKAKKAVTVKWKKQSAKMSSSRITGYQIQLATNSKFTKNKKTVTVKGYSKVSKKVTKLKGGKKYYVKVRTYKTVSGTKYYSPWSKVKTVKTKK